ncbi:uncharacterized protein [Lolium perenne]|uniref:uncharacterized protein n=1 Tax=Lolium perenne TaxID=4522 RepID=UPI0021F64B62|nr:uncharacterized protein LOC127343030 [Lolium perenne]XP_051225175.1 uncharacterized protein LOC127343030 [Lolium perenne]
MEAYEDQLDESLARNPRVDMEELAVYTMDDGHLEQGAVVARLITDANDGYRKLALSRKILLDMYIKGKYGTLEAQFWRKSVQSQKNDLEYIIDSLEKSKKNFRPMPTVFLTMPELLPKEKKH